MLAHTFTGTSVRSIVGLEGQRQVFERFRRHRRRERESLLPEPAVQWGQAPQEGLSPLVP
jgi:hypothetical protein